jgi:hypothetical protein
MTFAIDKKTSKGYWFVVGDKSSELPVYAHWIYRDWRGKDFVPVRLFGDETEWYCHIDLERMSRLTIGYENRIYILLDWARLLYPDHPYLQIYDRWVRDRRLQAAACERASAT